MANKHHSLSLYNAHHVTGYCYFSIGIIYLKAIHLQFRKHHYGNPSTESA